MLWSECSDGRTGRFFSSDFCMVSSTSVTVCALSATLYPLSLYCCSVPQCATFCLHPVNLPFPFTSIQPLPSPPLTTPLPIPPLLSPPLPISHLPSLPHFTPPLPSPLYYVEPLWLCSKQSRTSTLKKGQPASPREHPLGSPWQLHPSVPLPLWSQNRRARQSFQRTWWRACGWRWSSLYWQRLHCHQVLTSVLSFRS